MKIHADDRYTLLKWITAELLEARLIQAQFNKQSHDEDYADLETEIARHEQDGWVNAFEYIERKIIGGEFND
jgi:hypothetical protein